MKSYSSTDGLNSPDLGERQFYSTYSLFTNPDGLQESGSLAAKVVGKQDIKYDLSAVSNPYTIIQIGLFIPSTATTTVQKAGGLATGSFAQRSGE